ncbi:MAG: hypothetical protein K2W82_08195 [Candidatus Obscuribacterales bacterium]|nr:hypothetical protein [Candidatus Obscuribacterales bacterium]
MVSQRKPKTDETFVYVFWFEDSGMAFASPVDPISVAMAKRCGGCRCSEETGVCFKERGVGWLLSDKIVVDNKPSNEIICQACLIQEPVTVIGPRGRERKTSRSMLFLVKDNQDLLLQVKLWKSGHRLMKVVRTKYGEVTVLNKRALQAEIGLFKCPHCEQPIEVTLKERHSD